VPPQGARPVPRGQRDRHEGVPREPRIRTSFHRRLAGEKVRSAIRYVCAALTRAGAKFTGEQARLNQPLLTAMTQKSEMLDQLRRDGHYRAMLQIWLVAHIPLVLRADRARGFSILLLVAPRGPRGNAGHFRKFQSARPAAARQAARRRHLV